MPISSSEQVIAQIALKAKTAFSVGANANNVRLGIGPDQRIGTKFLRAGISFDGSSFPKTYKPCYTLLKLQAMT